MQSRLQELQRTLEASQASEQETQNTLQLSMQQLAQLEKRFSGALKQHEASLKQLSEQVESSQSLVAS